MTKNYYYINQDDNTNDQTDYDSDKAEYDNNHEYNKGDDDY